MTRSKTPQPDPQHFSWGNDLSVTPFIQPESKKHFMSCSRCQKSIDLGIWPSGDKILRHWKSEPCCNTAFKLAKQEGQARIEVCKLYNYLFYSIYL